MSQLTFDDVRKATVIRELSDKQRKILGLIAEQCTQATIAKLMNVSRSYVNQQVKYFQTNNLIQRIDTHPKKEGTREYTHFYQLSPEAKAQLTKDPLPVVSFHVHHIGIKYKITRQASAISVDKRISGTEPKPIRIKGSGRYAFWFPGKAGDPSVTLYVHPKTIVAWMDKGQLIIAPSIADAERISDRAIQRAAETFIDNQRRFGVHLEIDNGTNMGERHYGALLPEKHPDMQAVLENGVHVPGWWADKSPDDKIKGMGEVETDVLVKATGLETVINLAPQIVQLAQMPDLIRDTISPISAEILQVKAMMQGEVTMQTQYEAMVKFMTAALAEMQAMRKELEELRQERRPQPINAHPPTDK